MHPNTITIVTNNDEEAAIVEFAAEKVNASNLFEISTKGIIRKFLIRNCKQS